MEVSSRDVKRIFDCCRLSLLCDFEVDNMPLCAGGQWNCFEQINTLRAPQKGTAPTEESNSGAQERIFEGYHHHYDFSRSECAIIWIIIGLYCACIFCGWGAFSLRRANNEAVKRLLLLKINRNWFFTCMLYTFCKAHSREMSRRLLWRAVCVGKASMIVPDYAAVWITGRNYLSKNIIGRCARPQFISFLCTLSFNNKCEFHMSPLFASGFPCNTFEVSWNSWYIYNTSRINPAVCAEILQRGDPGHLEFSKICYRAKEMCVCEKSLFI